MRRAFLNIDAGELAEEPDELYRLAHVVNVACGGHAGDEASMRRVVACCTQFGTRVGAHPSYPDREGFGRRAMSMTAEALSASVAEQCRALAALAEVSFVKLHGALYHAANADRLVARAALAAAKDALGPSVTVIGPAAGRVIEAARELGLAFAREGFADRGVRADGSLVPRGEAGAMIADPHRAAARARELGASGAVDTICVHGDGENALAVARAVRRALDAWLAVRRLGDRAFRIVPPPGKSAGAVLAAARAWPGVLDAWTGEAGLAIELHEGATLDVEARVAELDDLEGPASSPAREHVVPVRYDGADLEDVARACSLSAARVAELHSRAEYIVRFVGFLPGFAYLGGLPRELEVPRLPSPRVRVPKNAVAIAGPYAGVYPFESPGGWRLLGTAQSVELFHPERGSLLRPGDRVRFREVR